MVTFINLKRLGRHSKAWLVLALAVVLCAWLALVMVRVSDNSARLLGLYIEFFISPFLFPMLQRKEFTQWSKAHPGAEPASPWPSVRWGLLGLFGLGVILVATPELFPGEVRDLEISISVPQTVARGEQFDILIDLENKAAHAQTLRNIATEEAYVNGISINRTDPDYTLGRPDVFYPGRVLNFDLTLPAGSRTPVRLRAVAPSVGEHRGTFTVCINAVTSCTFYEFKINVEEGED